MTGTWLWFTLLNLKVPLQNEKPVDIAKNASNCFLELVGGETESFSVLCCWSLLNWCVSLEKKMKNAEIMHTTPAIWPFYSFISLAFEAVQDASGEIPKTTSD